MTLVLLLVAWVAAPDQTRAVRAAEQSSENDLPDKPAEHRTIGLRLWVNSELDEPDDEPGDGVCRSVPSGVCTLRAAIMESNVYPGEERIDLPAGIFRLTRIGPAEDSAYTGDLDVTDLAQIVGTGGGRTIVDGNGTDRVFDIISGADVILKGLTIQNGAAFADEGYPVPDGGGIRNDATLTVVDCVIRDNRVVREGGHGGGLANTENGYILVQDTTFDGNRVIGGAGRGGGLDNVGDGDIVRTAFTNNQVVEGDGAAIANSGDDQLRLNNVTISTNEIVGRRGRGGGIWNTGTIDITNATIVNNTAPRGEAGGINNPKEENTATLRETIVAGNGDKNCAGRILSQGDNLEDADTCRFRQFGDVVNKNPRLGPLADNGGPTRTHALLPGSPAIDGGLNSFCGLIDQRNRPRYLDGDGDDIFRCDIGAFEVQVSERAAPAPGTERGAERRQTAERRQQRERTNKGGLDDERTEGQVIEVQCDASPASVSIAVIDGKQRLSLHEKALRRCEAIMAGDYIQAQGVKETEQQFEAYDFVLERAVPPTLPTAEPVGQRHAIEPVPAATATPTPTSTAATSTAASGRPTPSPSATGAAGPVAATSERAGPMVAPLIQPRAPAFVAR